MTYNAGLARPPRASGSRTSARKTPISRKIRASRGARSSTMAGAAPAPPQPLATLLSHATSLTEVLPYLHRYAISAAGGRCSLLFEHNARSDAMQATSGYGLDALPTGPWVPSPPEAALISKALSRSTATMASDAARQMPDLS